jgi:hypothetical protein
MKRRFEVHNQQGSILFVALMVLLILTTLGIAAISTTTTEVRITGNAALQNMVFYGADGGGRSYPPVLTETIENRAVPTRFIAPGGPVGDAVDLTAEIFGFSPNDGLTDDPFADPDLSAALDIVEVRLDLDRLQERLLAGGAAEFAGGYEGIGAASAGGNVGIYYQADSVGQTGQSQARLSEVYIHHVR